MSRPRVLIAGGGVAGLETLLALRALAADRVDITLLAPELKFVNRSMAVDQPFRRQRVRGIRLEETAAGLDARWHHGALDRVEHEQHRVVTKDGDELRYDMLVLAIGAHTNREWTSEGVLTYHGGRDGPSYRLLLRQLHAGRVTRLAFVKPAGASWPLPLYDLALMTAAECAAHDLAGVELSLITPEDEPLGIFGNQASAAIRRLLDDAGVVLHTSSYGVPGRPGRLDLSPGKRQLSVDRIITEPRLVGPRLRGIPAGRGGFIHTDGHGRLAGFDGVFAAGDATAFPIKQGGLAAQQADAVAETIAASVGAEIDPRPFRPILRGLLLTGGPPRYLRSDISGEAGDDSTISSTTLWWPPDKIAGRYLAPYLSSQVRDAPTSCPRTNMRFPLMHRAASRHRARKAPSASSDGVMAYEPTQTLPSPGVRILLSEVGFRARERELDQLRAAKRDDIGRRLRDARGYGEPGGNDEYLATREDEAIIDARIATLEAMLAQASVVEHRALPGVVGLGSVVTVDETDNGAGARYRLVGSHEAQESGDVSITSPVGQALLGRRASETVIVSLPDGRTRRLRIVSVAPPT